MPPIRSNPSLSEVSGKDAGVRRPTPDACQDFIDVLRWRAANQGDAVAFRFLKNGVEEDAVMTYREWDDAVRDLAARLQSLGLMGQRVLLMYPSSDSYPIALLACFYAGAIAVPMHPPRPNRSALRLLSAVQDAHPALALTTEAVRLSAAQGLADLQSAKGLKVLATDVSDKPPGAYAAGWAALTTHPGMVAYLQYSSGSTSSPKGVMVTHSNLLENCRTIGEATCGGSDDAVVSWLPFVHDMGLIGGLLVSLFLGCPLIFMPPEAFVMKPVRWLQAISRYRATLSPAPNFAYDLCVRRTTPEQRAALDLASWRIAFNGSERIDAASVRSFTEAFACSGFRPQTFFPCYGLAESTLFVTGNGLNQPPVIKRFDQVKLNAGTASPGVDGIELVGCGKPSKSHRLLIVDPKNCQELPPGRIGEIWVSGPSVAAGYWNNPDLTAQMFNATETTSQAGSFLRTGDLGFLLDGELFVTGRLKDLIIIGGRNIYPEDIEATVEQCHPPVVPHAAVAFSFNDGPVERLVIVAEIDYRESTGHTCDPPRQLTDNGEDVVRHLADAISRQHDVAVHEIVFVRRRTLPMTPSGKKMRSACRDAFLQRQLQVETL